MGGDRARPSASVPADRGAEAKLARELSADLYRVLAVAIVVIGHWLVSAVTFRDGRFGNDYPLVVLPWTQWLTLVFPGCAGVLFGGRVPELATVVSALRRPDHASA